MSHLFLVTTMEYIFPASEGFVGVTEASKEEVDSVRVRMVDTGVGSFSVVPRREVIIEASHCIVLQDIRESIHDSLGHPLEFFWKTEISDRSISATLWEIRFGFPRTPFPTSVEADSERKRKDQSLARTVLQYPTNKPCCRENISAYMDQK